MSRCGCAAESVVLRLREYAVVAVVDDVVLDEDVRAQLDIDSGAQVVISRFGSCEARIRRARGGAVELEVLDLDEGRLRPVVGRIGTRKLGRGNHDAALGLEVVLRGAVEDLVAIGRGLGVPKSNAGRLPLLSVTPLMITGAAEVATAARQNLPRIRRRLVIDIHAIARSECRPRYRVEVGVSADVVDLAAALRARERNRSGQLVASAPLPPAPVDVVALAVLEVVVAGAPPAPAEVLEPPPPPAAEVAALAVFELVLAGAPPVPVAPLVELSAELVARVPLVEFAVVEVVLADISAPLVAPPVPRAPPDRSSCTRRGSSIRRSLRS